MPPYSQTALDHFRSPRNAGALRSAAVVGQGSLDGRPPRTQLYLSFQDNRICRAGFTTFGCGAAIASASALTEMIVGQMVDVAQRIEPHNVIEALQGLPPGTEYCASIAVAALRDGLRQWRELSRVPNKESTADHD